MAVTELWDDLEATAEDVPTIPHVHTLPTWVLDARERDLGKEWIAKTRCLLAMKDPPAPRIHG